jgi:PAS domain-containing protein
VDPYWSFPRGGPFSDGAWLATRFAQVLASGEALKNFRARACVARDLQRPLWVLVDAYPQRRRARSHRADRGHVFPKSQKRKEAEEELRLLALAVARLHDVVMITEGRAARRSRARGSSFVNDAFEHLTGWSRTEGHRQFARASCKGPRDRPQRNLLGSAARCARGEPVHAETDQTTLRNGEPYWIEIDIVAIADRSGRIVHPRGPSSASSRSERTPSKRVLAAQGETSGDARGCAPTCFFDIDLDGMYHALSFAAPRNSCTPPAGSPHRSDDVPRCCPPRAAAVTMARVCDRHTPVGVSVGLQYELALPHGRCWFEFVRRP